MEPRIRPATAHDAPAVQAIYAPFVAEQATSFEVVVPDEAEMARRIEAHQDRYPWLVYEAGGTVLGYAYASSHHERLAYQWSVNVSVYIHPRAHRRGLGRALYSALFMLLRRQGFMNAYAGITQPNPASVGLHESMGFVPVGVFSRVGYKFDRWHDVAWFHLPLADTDHPSGPPLTTRALWTDPAVSSLLEACAASVRLDSMV